MAEQPTPHAVFDQFASLSKEDRVACLKILGGYCTAETPFIIASELKPSERFRLSEMLRGQAVAVTFPILLQAARQLAKEKAAISDEQFDRELNELVRMLVERQGREIAALERDQFKKQRDPKKRNIERDAEIVKQAREGKTSGQIHLAIKSRWTCTPAAVNQVIMRAKRGGLLPR